MRAGAVPVLIPVVLAGVPAVAVRFPQLFLHGHELAEAVHGSAVLGEALAIGQNEDAGGTLSLDAGLTCDFRATLERCVS